MRDRFIWKNRWLAKPQKIRHAPRRRELTGDRLELSACLSRRNLPEGSVEFTPPADLTIDNWSIQGNNRH
jgi:hypothetical protein